jgi:hypothetical protein
MSERSWLNLLSFSIPVKALFTGYILVTGVGLLMAGAQILFTVGMNDGKFGISEDDIVYGYYGNPNASKLEAMLHGPMKPHAPAAERLTIIKWAKNGAPKSTWEAQIKPIIEQRCAMCHAHMATIPNITKYKVIKKEAARNKGQSYTTMIRLAHIHLFGISFIFIFLGLIFSFAVGINKWVKAAFILTPFAFLILDVAGWWLTKWEPSFAWFIIIGGFGYSIVSGIMLFTSLYQMWIMPWRGKTSDENTWDGQW